MAEAYHNLGIVLLKKGNREEANNSFHKAVELKDDPNFRIAVASMAVEDGKLDEAKEQYDKVLQSDAGIASLRQTMTGRP